MRIHLSTYFSTYVLTLSLLVVPGLLSAGYLWRTDELKSYSEIVESQLARDAVWGSAIHGDWYAYKQQLVRQRRPELLALGSSRALQLREEFFTVPFTNAGGATVNSDLALRFLLDLPRERLPEAVLLDLDFWEFNDAYAAVRTVTAEAGTSTLSKLLVPLEGIRDRTITLSSFFWMIVTGKPRNVYTEGNLSGILAVQRAAGFRPDGSYQYGAEVLEEPTSGGSPFQGTLREVEHGLERLAPGAHVSEVRLSSLMGLLSFLDEHDIEIWAFSPPVAPEVYAAILAKGDAYAYLDEIEGAVRRLGLPFIDFLNPDSLGFESCEFKDGLHPGDVAYQRMLLEMVAADTTGNLRRLVNVDLLHENVEAFAGMTLTVSPDDGYLMEETDFRGIGCPKPG